MGITLTANDNYSTLHADTKTLVLAAVTAIRAAYASAATTDVDQKTNVKVILQEVVNLQEET